MPYALYQKCLLALSLSLLLACSPAVAPPLASPSASQAAVSPTPSVLTSVLPSTMPTAAPSAESVLPSVSPSQAASSPQPGVSSSPENSSLFLQGKVYDQHNQPLADAEVTLQAVPTLAEEPLTQAAQQQVTTDADGQYRFQWPHDQSLGLEITVRKAGLTPRRKVLRNSVCCNWTLLSPDGRQIQSLDLQLNQLDFGRNREGQFESSSALLPLSSPSAQVPLRLSGQVRNALGQAVGGVVLEVRRAVDNRYLGQSVSLADGSYLLLDLPAEDLQLSTVKQGYSRQQLNFNPTQRSQAELEINTLQWRGVVVDESQFPQSQIQLEVFSSDPAHPYRTELRSDARGEFAFLAPPGLELTLAALGNGRMTQTTLPAQPVGASPAPVRLQLERQHWEGQVLDHKGEPLAGAEISFKSLIYLQFPFETTLVSGADGRFQLNDPPLQVPVEVLVRKAGYVSRKRQIQHQLCCPVTMAQLSFGRDASGNLDFAQALVPLNQLQEKRFDLQGRVTGIQGAAVVGATVYARNNNGFESSTVTGADGSYFLPALPQGPELEIKAQHQDHGPVSTQLRAAQQLQPLSVLNLQFAR